MPPPDFNERQFEFCLNFQLQRTFGAYLIGGAPTIPSQLEESLRGYDAAYRFTSGRALFIQYKIAHFSPRAWGHGAPTYALWSAPYYRAHLHSDRYGRYTQHNTLVRLTSSSAEALYVSPCFHERTQLLAHFAGGVGTAALDHSVLAPLSTVPPIYDTVPHSITYPSDGSAFRLHSEPSPPYEAPRTLQDVVERVEETKWDAAAFIAVRNAIREILQENDVPLAEPPTPEGFDGPVSELAALLDQRVGAVLALIPSPEEDG